MSCLSVDGVSCAPLHSGITELPPAVVLGIGEVLLVELGCVVDECLLVKAGLFGDNGHAVFALELGEGLFGVLGDLIDGHLSFLIELLGQVCLIGCGEAVPELGVEDGPRKNKCVLGEGEVLLDFLETGGHGQEDGLLVAVDSALLQSQKKLRKLLCF